MCRLKFKIREGFQQCFIVVGKNVESGGMFVDNNIKKKVFLYLVLCLCSGVSFQNVLDGVYLGLNLLDKIFKWVNYYNECVFEDLYSK